MRQTVWRAFSEFLSNDIMRLASANTVMAVARDSDPLPFSERDNVPPRTVFNFLTTILQDFLWESQINQLSYFVIKLSFVAFFFISSA